MKNKLKTIVVLTLSISVLSGCNLLDFFAGNVVAEFKGRDMIIQSYDEESNIIDQVKGKSIAISPDDKFKITNSDGDTLEKSSVLNITVGGQSMVHVGSSLIMYEAGLENKFDEFAKTVDLNNNDRSIPIVNRMVNGWKNITTGKDKVILIRSQNGTPLATFVGQDVSYFASEIDKSTGILIDGKYLFIYRCDYTIYDAELLK